MKSNSYEGHTTLVDATKSKMASKIQKSKIQNELNQNHFYQIQNPKLIQNPK